MVFHKKSLKQRKEIGYKAGIGGYSNNLAQIYIKGEQYSQAIPLLNNAINFGSSNNSLSTLWLSHMILPILFMQIVRNKIINKSNNRYFLLLFFIFIYESFIAFNLL